MIRVSTLPWWPAGTTAEQLQAEIAEFKQRTATTTGPRCAPATMECSGREAALRSCGSERPDVRDALFGAALQAVFFAAVEEGAVAPQPPLAPSELSALRRTWQPLVEAGRAPHAAGLGSKSAPAAVVGARPELRSQSQAE